MPIFTKQLRMNNAASPEEAINEIANHLRYVQEQLEWQLSNLDSSNISELNYTQSGTDDSGTTVRANGFLIKGKKGEMFEVGIGDDGKFRFTLNGKNGTQMLYLNPDGDFYLTKNTNVTIDGGEWKE